MTEKEIAASKARLMAQQLRAQQEQMGDIEFQMDIAPQLGYRGEIDPSIAHVLNEPALTTKGYYIPDKLSDGQIEELRKQNGYRDKDGNWKSLPVKRGHIYATNADKSSAGDPTTFPHEYRHKQRPDMSETSNRLADAAMATTGRQWDAAVSSWRNWIRASKDKILKPSEAERDLLEKLMGWHEGGQAGSAYNLYKEDAERHNLKPLDKSFMQNDTEGYAQEQMDKSIWRKRYNTLKEFDKWSEELKERNDEREKYRKENK